MDPTQWWGHGFGFMWLLPLLFFVVLIFFLRGMFGQGSFDYGSRGGNTSPRESAREILDKRFAKGEITKEEYEEMRKTLGNETS
jgi:putative membrane protein